MSVVTVANPVFRFLETEEIDAVLQTLDADLI